MARSQPVPEGGFKQANIDANRAMYLAQAEDKFDKWQTLNFKARGIIYNMVNHNIKPMIVNELTAAAVFQRLKEAYEQHGIASIFEQAIKCNNLKLKDCNGLEQ